MANLIRCSKSGSDWTANELEAYNIHIRPQTAVQFFGTEPSLSLAHLDPLFVNGTLQSEDLSDQTYRLLQYLNLASRPNPGQESAIDDAAREVLRAVGYEERGTLLLSRYNIPLVICGDSNQSAQIDVCLTQGSSTILLVVQGNKTEVSCTDPEPQVIAEAIAAYQYNNFHRARAGVDELEEMVIPCISMIGTRPIFYRVPVTRALSMAVVTGQYPSTPTQVVKCVVTQGSRRLREGMEVPNYRKIALQYYDAFRTVAKQYWSAFILTDCEF